MIAGRVTSPPTPAGSYLGRGGQLLLLVIEPLPEEAARLQRSLHRQFNIVLANTAAEGLLSAGEFHPDVVLTAAQLPDISSEHLVRTLQRHRRMPVIIGAGTADRDTAAVAMRVGATACVPRPYRISELESLVRSLRPARTILAPVECGPVRLDPESQRVFLHDRPIDLPPQECHLLYLFMSNCDRLLTREQIRRKLWPGLPDERSNTITVHVRRLRLRLAEDPWNPTAITTVRGKGYCFTASGTRTALAPR